MAYFTKNENGDYVEVTETLHTAAEFKAVKEKNNELRATNTNLLKSNESLSAFADVLDGATNVTPEALMKKIEAKAAERANSLVEQMRTKHGEMVNALETELNGSKGTLSKLLLGSEVQRAGAKHGVVATAYDDVVRRAEADFIIKEGKVAFKEDKLDASGNAYTVDSWMADQAKAAPHLFATSQGPAAKRNANVTVAPIGNDNMRPADRISAGLASKSA